MKVIEVQSLVKKYPTGVVALNGLNLSVKKGEIFALLGQNGAGKSTLINILSTELKPTCGSVVIDNKTLKEQLRDIRFCIARVAQRPSIDEHLSLYENMLFQSELYNIPPDTARRRIGNLIEQFNLRTYLNVPIPLCSGGIKRRLDIALSLMSNPKILFLDEPTTGLDISSRLALWDIVKTIKTMFETTIFLTTHYLEEADELSDTICIIDRGKEVLQASPAQMKNTLPQNVLKATFATEKAAKYALETLVHCKTLPLAHRIGVTLSFNTTCPEKDLLTLNRFLLDHTLAFTGIELVKPTLNEVFIHLTETGKGEHIHED